MLEGVQSTVRIVRLKRSRRSSSTSGDQGVGRGHEHLFVVHHDRDTRVLSCGGGRHGRDPPLPRHRCLEVRYKANRSTRRKPASRRPVWPASVAKQHLEAPTPLRLRSVVLCRFVLGRQYLRPRGFRQTNVDVAHRRRNGRAWRRILVFRCASVKQSIAWASSLSKFCEAAENSPVEYFRTCAFILR